MDSGAERGSVSQEAAATTSLTSSPVTTPQTEEFSAAPQITLIACTTSWLSSANVGLRSAMLLQQMEQMFFTAEGNPSGRSGRLSAVAMACSSLSMDISLSAFLYAGLPVKISTRTTPKAKLSEARVSCDPSSTSGDILRGMSTGSESCSVSGEAAHGTNRRCCKGAILHCCCCALCVSARAGASALTRGCPGGWARRCVSRRFGSSPRS